MRHTLRNQAKQARHPPRRTTPFIRARKEKLETRKMLAKEDQAHKHKEVKERPRPGTLLHVAARVPYTCFAYQSACCHATLPAAFFLLSSYAVSLLPLMFPLFTRSLRRVSIHSSCCPRPPLPRFPLITPHGEYAALSVQLYSGSYHLKFNRSAASRIPRYHIPACFYCSGPQRELHSKRQRGRDPVTFRWRGTPYGLHIYMYGSMSYL